MEDFSTCQDISRYQSEGYFQRALDNKSIEDKQAAMIVYASLFLIRWKTRDLSYFEQYIIDKFENNWWDESSLLGARFVRVRYLKSDYPGIVYARNILLNALMRCEPLPRPSKQFPRWYTVVYNHIIDKL